MYTTLPNAMHFNIIKYILWIVYIIQDPVQLYLCYWMYVFYLNEYIFKYVVTNKFRNIIQDTIEIKKKLKSSFTEKRCTLYSVTNDMVDNFLASIKTRKNLFLRNTKISVTKNP